MVSTGCQIRPDQGGRRCAKGDLLLKLVVKVNVAREVRTPYHYLSAIFRLDVAHHSMACQTEDTKTSTHHRYPYMYPPTRQKPMHNRPLRRKHMRILLRAFLLLLLLRQLRPGIIHRSIPSTHDPAITSLHDSARWMRRRPELVWFFQDAGVITTVITVLGSGRAECTLVCRACMQSA